MKLVLENKDGRAVRFFHVDTDSAWVVSRKDTRRIEIHSHLERLEQARIKFEPLSQITESVIKDVPLVIGDARLRCVAASEEVITDESPREGDGQNIWRMSLLVFTLLQFGALGLMHMLPEKSATNEAALKQEVVQIVKRIPVKQVQPVSREAAVAPTETQAQPTRTTRKTASIKRMGALAAFGSLKNGKQQGGINLGAANTTAGPGLGGNAGSGGVQTTLYGKGLVSAPLGAGGNVQGGGGYGTKGKGGGQAGYGRLSLVGSAGTASIPLGREALIEGGLDRDLIADVINRNMGQIRFCYEQGLQGNPALAGRVGIGFTIGVNGQVKLASVENTTLNSKLVEDCIVLRLKTWKFPLPEGGTEVKVSYPFMLRRAGQS